MALFKRANKKTEVKIIEECAPRVIISSNALTKMKLYTEGCSDEIGWLGTAHRHQNTIYICDMMLFDQDVHGTTTEITPEGLATFAEELLQRDDGVEIWNSMKVWGHSHVNMGITPSSTDEGQMKTFAGNGHDFFIRIITNKKGDIGIDLFDYESGISFLGLNWQESVSEEEEQLWNQISLIEEQIALLKNTEEEMIKEEVTKDIEEKVRKKVTTYGRTYAYSGNNPHQESYLGRGYEIKKNTDVVVEGTSKLGGIEDYLTTQDLLYIGECETIEEIQDYIKILALTTVIDVGDTLLMTKLKKYGEKTVDAFYGVLY